MDTEQATAARARASAVFVGEGTLLVQCAEIFLRAGHEIQLIVSSEPRARQWAAERGLRRVDDADRAELEREPFDYLFNVSGQRVLPASALASARRLALNFHDGPLPRYAGLHATSWALFQRESRHGVTWHEMTERVDAGRIAAQQAFEVRPGDTAFTLNARCYEAGIATFAEVVDAIGNGTLTLTPQDAAERTYFAANRRPEAACALRWDRPAEDLAGLAAGLDFGTYHNPLGLPKVLLAGDGEPPVGGHPGGGHPGGGHPGGGHAGAAFVARVVSPLGERSGAAPGTLVRVDDAGLHVATASADVALGGLCTLDGRPLTPREAAERFGLAVGRCLPRLDEPAAARLSSLYARVCRHEPYWIERLGEVTAPDVPYARHAASSADVADGARHASLSAPLPAVLAALPHVDGSVSLADRAVALFSAHLGRLGAGATFTLDFSEPSLRRAVAGAEALFATHVPLRAAVDRDASLAATAAAILAELGAARRHETYACDLVPRTPELRDRGAAGAPTRPVVVELVERPDDPYVPPVGCELAVLIAADGSAIRWVYDSRVYAAEGVSAMQRGLVTLARAAVARPDAPLRTLPLLDTDERRRVLVDWNATARPYDAVRTVHELVADQALRTPDRVALCFEEQRRAYGDVDESANRLARHLQALGVGPESLVGVCLDRSPELVIALLAVMKAGGAYVPLDPSYPRDRLQLMAGDAGLAALVTREDLAGLFDGLACPRVLLDRDADRILAESPALPRSGVTAEHAAYVIYTSGSTGRPKGVVITHRNVASFFAGMDERIPRAAASPDEPPGVWLAVTSPSFDISVLELFWTLARGFTVVLGGDAERAPRQSPPTGGPHPPAPSPARGRGGEPDSLDFSLFYFGSDGGANAGAVADAYRLLLDGARFADRHGFRAVWTPERHFHAFGGLFPNPSVAAAALATITERVELRAGSCVLPLHSPIRVAEEWSLVDNLSQGRVGISFAAGWQPNDFVLAPGNYAERAAVMRRDVDVVRRLWRGEAVAFPGPDGAPVPVTTLPRPVQPELPAWITAASNPETFRLAGELGCGILTHLLGQRYEDVQAKIRIYRDAWQVAGHPGCGHAVLMVHTFVADDPAIVRAAVREPLIGYLRDSVDLIEKAAWSFPAFASMAERTGLSPSNLFDDGRLGAEELAALLEHAFERYFATSGLFGTPESCLETLGQIAATDADEVACLVDFGIPADTVLGHLPHLARLMELWQGKALTPGAFPADYSLPALIARHGVTHFQCTPSMAGMLLLDERARGAFGSLRCLMVGGEALPAGLAADLKRLVGGVVLNMYGPTETTIWSATYAVAGDEASVPVGRPIANTTLYVVDEDGQPVPPGVPGELLIGGAGVARGYLHRPELTAERFVPNPFSSEPGTADDRLYRTGDRVRYRHDGTVEFLGRLDFQVKLRGHRIELGEIEAELRRHPAVHEAAVLLREDAPGGAALAAYVTPSNGAVDVDAVRTWVGQTLPQIMVPSSVSVLSTFPRTPNGKLDRRALAEPAARPLAPQPPDAGRPSSAPGDRGASSHPAGGAAPRGDLEATIAGVWREVLGLAEIDVTASFFDLGGHSLLAAQALYLLRGRLGRDLSITDVFRFPTVRALAQHLGTGDDAAAVRASRDRAEARRDILARRRLARQSR